MNDNRKCIPKYNRHYRSGVFWCESRILLRKMKQSLTNDNQIRYVHNLFNIVRYMVELDGLYMGVVWL